MRNRTKKNILLIFPEQPYIRLCLIIRVIAEVPIGISKEPERLALIIEAQVRLPRVRLVIKEFRDVVGEIATVDGSVMITVKGDGIFCTSPAGVCSCTIDAKERIKGVREIRIALHHPTDLVIIGVAAGIHARIGNRHSIRPGEYGAWVAVDEGPLKPGSLAVIGIAGYGRREETD